MSSRPLTGSLFLRYLPSEKDFSDALQTSSNYLRVMQEYMKALPAKAQSPFCLDQLDESLAAQPTSPEIINNITTKTFTTSVYLREGHFIALAWPGNWSRSVRSAKNPKRMCGQIWVTSPGSHLGLRQMSATERRTAIENRKRGKLPPSALFPFLVIECAPSSLLIEEPVQSSASRSPFFQAQRTEHQKEKGERSLLTPFFSAIRE